MFNFCECQQDGFCLKYQRNMGGRFRQICAGANVDLGTAAAFREQWQREANTVESNQKPIPLLLKTDQAPGDAVAMTAAVYSLHKTYPGKYITAVESQWPEVFEHNPNVWQGAWSGNILDDFAELQMHYPAIHQSNERGIHFMQGWCEFLGMALGVSVPLLTNRPHLYFADQAPPSEDYWLICSGGKRDFTNKLWGTHKYEQVVDMLAERGVLFVQVGDSNGDHPRIPGTLNMLGKTTLRQLFDLCRRAQGVLCGVSLLMHVAAALEKPAVVVAGGREPVAWNAYPKQHYLHTVGTLPCRDVLGNVGGACWRSRVIPLGDGTILDKNTCEYPVDGLPKCMEMITPEHVALTIAQIVESSQCRPCS